MVGALRVVPGSRPAKGFVTDCEKKVAFWFACWSCATVGTLRLRAPPAWLSFVLMLCVRLPTYETSTTTLHGNWCCTPNEYEFTYGILRSGLLKVTLWPANVSRPSDAPVGGINPCG